ncbi:MULTISPECIES: WecB/TagA/CpsF family glycosyltransferase [unclassified Arthrobacter]|uniref:WecB/TagA/CpsF family glycosyltransferase n=1 Tax=unclassified Arthrobacter TaxID=235627 RepID=UPI003394ABFE
MILGRDRLRLLDVEVTALPEQRMAGVLGDLIATGGRRTVVGHNLHSCYLYHTLPDFKALYDSADVVLLDGAPVYAAWKLQGHAATADSSFRVGSTDWIKHLGSVTGLDRVAVVGTNSLSNAAACRKLETLLPGTKVLGWAGEDWHPERELAVVHELRDFGPNLVLVGLGMPLQESFLWQRRDELPDAVYGAVGGALDQISGHQRLAPRWLGRLGFEWLWRLVHSPRRVFGRVFFEPWKLAVVLAGRKLRAMTAGASK